MQRIETAGSEIQNQPAEPHARATQIDGLHRDREEFVYIVSHDLKEPLAGIRAYSEILLEDYEEKLDADGRERLSAMIEICNRMASSIDSLLEYCRVGRLRAPRAEVDLNALLEEVLRTFRPRIERRGAAVHVAGRLPVVQGDPALVAKVFANLISNGLKFNQTSEPRVEIGLLPGDPPTIYVRDNGIGIAEKHHHEIFTIFRRLHGLEEYEGSGAGLTIVHRIIESHGGRVWLESEPGRGTTFFFTFGPAAGAASPETEPAKPPHWLHRSRDLENVDPRPAD